MKNILEPLAKSVLVPLGLTAAASVTDVAIQQKNHGSWTISIISSNEMEDIMKIVKSLEESGLLIKGASEAVVNKAKEQKGEFFSGFVGGSGTLVNGLLGNLLASKGTIKADEWTIRAGHDF